MGCLSSGKSKAAVAKNARRNPQHPNTRASAPAMCRRACVGHAFSTRRHMAVLRRHAADLLADGAATTTGFPFVPHDSAPE